MREPGWVRRKALPVAAKSSIREVCFIVFAPGVPAFLTHGRGQETVRALVCVRLSVFMGRVRSFPVL